MLATRLWFGEQSTDGCGCQRALNAGDHTTLRDVAGDVDGRTGFDVGRQEYRYNSIDVRPGGWQPEVSRHAHRRDRSSPLID